jgi:hypothetical protein
MSHLQGIVHFVVTFVPLRSVESLRYDSTMPRQRIYKSDAERQKAFRDRRSAELKRLRRLAKKSLSK